MTTIETITDKLHSQADTELRNRLSTAYAAIRQEFTDGRSKTIAVQGGFMAGCCNEEKEYNVDAHKALTALEKLSFLMQRDTNRNAKVSEFMAKVESLHSQVEELQTNLS